jgi:hypothetical protein
VHEQSDSKKGLLSPQEQKINKKVKKMPKEKNKLIETKTHWSQGRLSQPFPMPCFLLCLVQPCFASHVVSPRVCHMETPTVSFDNYTGPVWGPPVAILGAILLLLWPPTWRVALVALFASSA